MSTKRRRSAIHNVVACCVTLLGGFACSTGAEPATPPDQPVAAGASRTVQVGAELAVADSERVAATVTVRDAQPTAGDGDVRLFRRARLTVPGASSAFAIEGVSGAVRHGILVVVDSVGAIRIVTHKWSNADNSVVAQTDCGARHECPASQISADPRTGAVVFTGLVLTGLNGNTGDAATSTLTGRVP